MVHLTKLFVAAASVLPAVQGCITIQHQFPKGQGGDSAKAAAIAKEYRYVWNEYVKYAFGNDSLLPLNHSAENDLFGWGATIVDGIDTAVVMGLTDIVEQQLAFIARTNFNKPQSLVDEFDAMIRYIGGLLSAYDLINSPLVPKGTYNQQHVQALLTAAKTISDHLKPMFNSPSGLPYANINFTNSQYANCEPLKPCNVTTVDTAVCGTLILEWYRLSDLTGDNSYRQLAARAEANLISPSQKLIYPNIVSGSLNITTGKYIGFDGGWQAGIDSFYEYLIKTYIYSPSQTLVQQMKNFWVGAVQSTIKYLIKHPFEHPELSFISQLDNNGTLEYAMDDYACFAGGNFLLGGQYLGNQQFVNYGIALADSCHQLFNHSAAGLNPVTWSWFNSKNQTYDPADEKNSSAVASQAKNGFYTTNAFWGAFPEPIESMWYAYRITGDTRWQGYVWEAFQSMIHDTQRSPSVAFAQLNNVSQPLGGTLNNYVPSFFFAEVLKYMYLTFSDPSVVSLDEYVFNTECHPLKIQGGTCATSGYPTS